MTCRAVRIRLDVVAEGEVLVVVLSTVQATPSSASGQEGENLERWATNSGRDVGGLVVRRNGDGLRVRVGRVGNAEDLADVDVGALGVDLEATTKEDG